MKNTPNSKDTKANNSVANFKKAINNMIATSTKSYNGDISFTKGTRFHSFTREEILRTIETGSPEGLKEASVFFTYSSGLYRRFLTYYATLLKYSYLLVPHMKGERLIEDKKSMNHYNDALEFMSSLKLKTLCRQIAFIVLSEGAFYGILRDFERDGATIQLLPQDYCRSRFKNQFGVDMVELDLTYFDTIRDKEVRDEVLNSFPREIKNAYWDFKNRGASKWYMMSAGTGVYFKLYDDRPFFSSILPAIIDFADYRVLEKAKDTQELKGLLVQQLPVEDGELVFEPEEMEEMHRGAVEMLKNSANLDVLTSVANVKLENLESNRSVVTNNLDKISDSIYTEAGVSKQLFAAEGNLALTHSITNDTALMMTFADSFATWLEYVINNKFGDNQMNFKVKALPFTYYNENDQRSSMITLAQAGYSFLLPALACGLDQQDLSDIKSLETKALKLSEIMIPLSSSYTTSSGNPQEKEKEAEKDDTQKDDRTIENINAE